ncbi:MAG: 16S rRNA (adenine(1518)-N(6)/adenine(1519)-N(6))-dimethyltransferase RsmA [Bacilli bacterium]
MDGKQFIHKKSLGQNFLNNSFIVNKIIESADIIDDSLIIEIGPGEGVLTKELTNKNAFVLAFEIDKRLKEKLDLIAKDNLEVVYENFLEVDISKYVSKYKYSRLLVIANLPYYITTAIVQKIINSLDVYEIIIMVQKEVALRYMAKPCSRSYNSLSVYLSYYFDIFNVAEVSRENFNPIPNVDSTVIKMIRKEKAYKVINEEYFFKLVKDSFKQKRKNLKNNLKDYDLITIEEILKKHNKSTKCRAEEIEIDEFVEISNKLC